MNNDNNYFLTASLICGDPLGYKEEIKLLEEGKSDFIHFDVMDGSFVPRYGLYTELLESVKKETKIPVEVHMMVDNPEPYVEELAKAGAEYIAFHIEPVYHIHRVIKKIKDAGAKAGDALVLTKPLGTGIINTAIKGGMASKEAVTKVSESMIRLNKNAALAMQEVGVNACTDVTGFSLLGHASEMLQNNDFGMTIHSATVPFFSEASEYAQMGLVPAGTYRNKDFYSQWIELNSEIPASLVDILFDPQTSGGLLISVPGHKTDNLLCKLEEHNVKGAAIIGEILAEPKRKIIVK